MTAPEKCKQELALLRRQVRSARRLISQALDAIPWYTDGRNDRLTNAMEKWIFETDAKKR